jgi:hypothetical protein
MSGKDAVALMARTRDLTADFTRTWEAWNDGAITASAVREITMGLTSVYRGQPAEIRAEMRDAEAVLVELAKTVPVTTLLSAIEQLRAVVDADGMTRSALDAYDDQSLSLTTVGTMAVLRGYLTHEAHALIATALDQIIDEWYRNGTLTPQDQPSGDETTNTRTRRARAPHLAALALVELARRQVENGLLGSRHEVKPHVTLIVDADTVAQGLPGELLITGKHEPVLLPAESVRRILCDAEITDVVTTTRTVFAKDPDSDDGDSHEDNGGQPSDPRSEVEDCGDDQDRELGEARRVDAPQGRPGATTRLPGLLEAALGDGVRTTDDLIAWLRHLSRTMLYIGGRRRTATKAQRAALLVRDRHCQFPDCTVDPTRCDAHHVQHWELGGGTDLDNLVLLCGGHHHLVHEGRWTITADRDLDAGSRGYWTFAPPLRRQP